MQFKLTVRNDEVAKLLFLFNVRFPKTEYTILSHDGNDVNINVETSIEYEEDIYEALIEKFDTLKIEETLSCRIKALKSIVILNNGKCLIFNENDERLTLLEGDWHEKCRDILVLADGNTRFHDER
jgi:hypothetical protein